MDALSFATFTCLLASIPIKYPGKSLGSLVGQVYTAISGEICKTQLKEVAVFVFAKRR